MKREKTKQNTTRLQLCVPLCLHQLIPLFFFPLRVPESTEGVPQGGVLVTTIPACTAINHAAAVTAEESD